MYKEKLHFSLSDEAAVTAIAENYVHGLQWVLFYYYRGVPSWSWFYRYHYSPKITGISIHIRSNFRCPQGPQGGHGF
jgi:5'-3' exoribonuclease 1